MLPGVRVLCLVFLASALGCAQTTDCDYIDVPPTGDLARDIVGCWQGFGFDGLVVYQFNPDATYRYVEEPGYLFASGRVLLGGYSVGGGLLDLGVGIPPLQTEVTATSLRFPELGDALRRGVCRGYGFDHGETCPSP